MKINVYILTWTDDRCIFTVTAVLFTPSTVQAWRYRTFITQTLDIVQPYLPTSLTEVRSNWSIGRIRKAKRATNDLRVVDIPVIITNWSPSAIVIYLYSPFSTPASSNESDRYWGKIVGAKFNAYPASQCLNECSVNISSWNEVIKSNINNIKQGAVESNLMWIPTQFTAKSHGKLSLLIKELDRLIQINLWSTLSLRLLSFLRVQAGTLRLEINRH